MGRLRKKLAIQMLTLFSFVSFEANAGVEMKRPHQVESGECLSGIAAQEFVGRVWGEGGSLERLLALNPTLASHPDRIYVGQEIAIGSEPSVAPLAESDSKKPVTKETTTASTKETTEEAPTEVASTGETSVEGATAVDSDESSAATTANLAEPTRDVASLESPEPITSSKTYGIFSSETGFAATRISGMDSSTHATATLLTKSNFGERLRYDQVWSDRFQTGVYFGIQSLSFDSPSTSSTINNPNLTTHQFGLGASYRVSPKWTLAANLGMSQEVYVIGLSNSAVRLDQMDVPVLNLEAAYKFFELDTLTAGAKVNFGMEAPASSDSYKSSFNLSYGLDVFVTQRVCSWLQLETGVGADYREEDTSVSTQSQLDLGMYVKLNFAVGGKFK